MILTRGRALAAIFLVGLPAQARTLEVGPGKSYAHPSDAAAAAMPGDRVTIAPGEYFDCAVWPQSDLLIEGDPGSPTVITDKTCQGKALFVIQGNDVTVRNLTLTRARVPDGNGAGIRAEGRNLLVERVRSSTTRTASWRMTSRRARSGSSIVCSTVMAYPASSGRRRR